MNLLSLAYFFAFMIYVWLVIFVLSRNVKAKLNRICALLISSFGLWAFGMTFMNGSASPDEAMLWDNISSSGWCSFPCLGLWFSLVLSKREKVLKKWFFYPLILFIPFVFIYQQWSGNLISDYLKISCGWVSVWSTNLWTYLFYVYYISCMIMSLYLFLDLWKKTKISYEKKQVRIIFIVTLVSVIFGSITDVVLPQLRYNTPSIASIITLVWAGGIAYAITKYKLMTVTVAVAATEIVSTMPDTLFVILPNTSIVDINNAACELTGYSREELIGKPVEMLIAEKTSPFNGEGLKRILKEGKIKDYSVSYLTKNGESIPVSFSGSVIQDSGGNIIGIVGIGRDMRDILRMHQKEKMLLAEAEKMRIRILEEARAGLEKMVAQRTTELEKMHLASLNIMEDLDIRKRELEKAYEDLKDTQSKLIQSEKLAAVGQLAGGVAHEINNPIGVILGFTQSIVKRIKENDQLYMPLKSIEREAIRCKNLVGDLLTFSRIGKTQTEAVIINETIEESISLIEAQAKIRNIEIIKEYGESLPKITAYKNQLQQVIMNLCNNAMDAMPEGGEIRIKTGQVEQGIEIYITDTGTGMIEEVKKHLFEPFFTTKEVGKGTGLGLSLCYEIIQRHNGTIEVESEIGKGTAFIITLPAG